MYPRADAIAIPHQWFPTWDRIRGLYNGIGYLVLLAIGLDLWWTIQAAIPHIGNSTPREFAAGFLGYASVTAYTMLPSPFLVPPLVNLAPRAGWRRILFLLAGVIPMSWWCLVFVEGVHFGWSWSSIGYALDGLLTTGLVVGMCAYHTYSREAADSLLRVRIGQTRMTSELQRAQLRLLRAQIEPHFLFNTLSVVRALARNDRRATVEMLDNLIRYFAAAIPKLSGSEVVLAQEMQLIDAYLAIYRARMGARLAYDIVLPEDLTQMTVPPMILLTLVENALKHGVNPAVEGGVIRISAALDQGWLRLEVSDSGQGLAQHQGHGTGLANIRQRLLMLYGPDALLSLKPGEPRGMVASILLPPARRAA
ncbi:MAG TPA: histidine kinase [Steroidobacteraceae bacterium]|nr:histidine kinase [Steroidobacteraceae bacterium]